MKVYSYVLGFVFDTDFRRVLLETKKSPSWQFGKLNGIGRSADGDPLTDAMVDVFQTKLNVDAPFKCWKPAARLSGLTRGKDMWIMVVYAMHAVRTRAAAIGKTIISSQGQFNWYDRPADSRKKRVDFVDWLVPLCRDRLMLQQPVLKIVVDSKHWQGM